MLKLHPLDPLSPNLHQNRNLKDSKLRGMNTSRRYVVFFVVVTYAPITFTFCVIINRENLLRH
jgi:hypothetical protein